MRGALVGKIIVLPSKWRGRPALATKRRKSDAFSKEASAIQIEFAQRLKIVRRKHYEYAAGGARALGIEDETYRRWERAETEPSIENIQKICAEFQCGADFLVLNKIPS